MYQSQVWHFIIESIIDINDKQHIKKQQMTYFPPHIIVMTIRKNKKRKEARFSLIFFS